MIISHSEEETWSFGFELATGIRRGDVVAIDGDLGAGKTALVKGLAAGLGFAGDVTSPTFSIVQEYRGGREPIAHFDFYRMESQGEIVAAGLEEYFDGEYVVAVEWAGKFPDLMPAGTLRVKIVARGEFEREISVR